MSEPETQKFVIPKRMFLERGLIADSDGHNSAIDVQFASEEILDQELWLDPEEADSTILALLNEHRGTLNRQLHRIAMKAVAIPLFQREFQGTEVSPSTAVEVNNLKHANAIILNRYLELIDDSSINQGFLAQAISELVILQLAYRHINGDEHDNIIVFPIHPSEHKGNPSFTVLHKESQGRGHLYLTERTKYRPSQGPDRENHRIYVSEQELTGNDAAIIDLAEALIHERTDDISENDRQKIAFASHVLMTKINTQFSYIQRTH